MRELFLKFGAIGCCGGNGMVKRVKTSTKSVYITDIFIKNFRSIGEADIPVSQMNVFVGLNDAGKSNVLKALDWFFNKSNDQDYSSNAFRENYSFYNDRKTNKAYEIIVRLTLFLPAFRCNTVVWEKVWRLDEVRERFLDSNGREIDPSNYRVRTAARRLKYKYVPAVKGKNVFAELLRDLYLTLSVDDSNVMLQNAEHFSESIAKYTADITKDIKNILAIDSKIGVPKNMSSIFSSLKFDTNEKGRNIPLENRGDGIQARHIPSLLKFISDHDIKRNHRGKVSSNILWGYEEPENGVELAQCFKMAQEFLDLSYDFQMFITTHSPAFYSIGNDNKEIVETYFVQKDGSRGSVFLNDSSQIDARMGLMPLIAPYIQEKEKEISDYKKRLEQISKENQKLDCPSKILIVEDTDKRVIDFWKYFIDDKSIAVLPGGGCTNKTQEHWIAIQKQRHNDYSPRVLKIIDRDGYTNAQAEYINGKQKYPQFMLPVCELENFAIIDNDLFSQDFFEKHKLELYQNFHETASPNLRKLDLEFKSDSGSVGLFAIKGETSKVIKQMWQEAATDWRRFVNGKELCKLIENFDWLAYIKQNPPADFLDLIKKIKAFYK